MKAKTDRKRSFCLGRQTITDLFPDRMNRNSSSTEPADPSSEEKDLSKIYTRRNYPPTARLPRIVKISLEKKFSFPTRLVRLEFDHSNVSYYSEIDTVTLSGRITSNYCTSSEDSIVIPLSSVVSQTFLNNSSPMQFDLDH